MKELFSVRKNETAYEIRGNEIIAVRTRDIESSGARIGDASGIRSASAVGQVDPQQLYARAEASPAMPAPWLARRPSPEKAHFKSPTLKPSVDAFAMAEQALAFLRSETEGFIFSGKVVNTHETRHLVDDAGTDLSAESQDVSMTISVRAQGSPNISDLFWWFHGAEDLRPGLEELVPYLEKFHEPATLEPGRWPVCLVHPPNPFAMGNLFKNFKTDSYSDGATYYKGRLGSRIWNERLSLYDVTQDPITGVYRPFDGEGVRRSTERLALVENGVFKSTISDARAAYRYGGESTGNGQRSASLSAISLDYNQISFGHGEQTRQGLLGNLDHCVVVLMGFGGADQENGSFSSPVQLAYLTRAGRIVGRLPQLTIASHYDEFFGADFIGASKDRGVWGTESPALFGWMNVILN